MTNVSLKIAKNVNSTADELDSLVGVDVVIDRLLAKHRNASPKLLEKLSFHDDGIVCENLVTNPAVTRDILIRLGPSYQEALFANPSLAVFLKNDSNIPLEFGGDGLIEILKNKLCPDAFVDWLVKCGSEEHQAAYLVRNDRRLNSIKKLFKSKHSRIINSLLVFHKGARFLFAKELGYVPSDIDLNLDEIDIDEKSLDLWAIERSDKFELLWKQLVPPSGCANTLQGEVVRALGRIRYEYWHNGNMNWDGVFYKNLAKLIKISLKDDKKFSQIAKKVIDLDVASIMSSGRTGRKISQGKLPILSIFGGSFLIGSDVEESHARLAIVISVWRDRNPEMIPYSELSSSTLS